MPRRSLSRRDLLQIGAGIPWIALPGCSSGEPAPRVEMAEAIAPARTVIPGLSSDAATPAATATPTPLPVPPAGVSERVLLEGTSSETRLVVRHSGVRGPAVMVLGGVHGNEPGGWLAADDIASWAPNAGSLAVIPRANIQAIAQFVRTTDQIGDLNRLYPGDPQSPLLMERMAAAIVAVCRELHVELLLDMHESWAFYAEQNARSTASLGQTVTGGVGPLTPKLAELVVSRVNAAVGGTRDELILRDGAAFGRPSGTPQAGQGARGRSSLSAGGHVEGLTPVLVEMGQESQPVARRVALHLMVARAALEGAGIL